MSRRSLKKLVGQRIKVEATFRRYGYRYSQPEQPTALLEHVTSNGQYLTDHLWISINKQNKHALKNLKPDEIISFTAQVIQYTRQNNHETSTDFSINKIRCINKIKAYPSNKEKI